jgi:hypothetical protein
VIVEITDRGPARLLLKGCRKIDLSRAAFAKLADPDLGLIDVTVKRQRIYPLGIRICFLTRFLAACTASCWRSESSLDIGGRILPLQRSATK